MKLSGWARLGIVAALLAGCDNAELKDFRALCKDISPSDTFGGGWILLPPAKGPSDDQANRDVIRGMGKVYELA